MLVPQLPVPTVPVIEEASVVQAEEIPLEVEEQKTPSSVEKALSLVGKYGGECVSFIQKLYDQPKGFSGVARTIMPNTEDPVVGDAILTNESPYGHVALITEISEDSFKLCESNYESKWMVTCGREIEKADGRIRGFYALAKLSP